MSRIHKASRHLCSFFNVCVYNMYLCSLYVCLCACLCAPVFRIVHAMTSMWRSGHTHGCCSLPSNLSETVSSLLSHGQASRPRGFQEFSSLHLSLCYRCTGIVDGLYLTGFYMSAASPDSGSWARVATALPTEPSLQPQICVQVNKNEDTRKVRNY